jgi:hypothetical protein
VECRLLFSGVTSSQGITLASHQNIHQKELPGYCAQRRADRR